MKIYLIGTGLALLSTLAWAQAGLDPSNGYFGNPSFEHRLEGWHQYIDPGSKDCHCTLEISDDSPHSGNHCARLSSLEFAHHSISGLQAIRVEEGQRFRVAVWIRAAPDAETKPGLPGALLRVTCKWKYATAPEGHYFVNADGSVQRLIPTLQPIPMPLPHEWTKLEAVIEIGPRIDEIGAEAYCWAMKGSLDVDDFTLEPVPRSTPLTPFSPGPSETVPPAPPADPATSPPLK